MDEPIVQRRYGTSEYTGDLIRCDREGRHLRDLRLAGAAAEPGSLADDRSFDGLRDEVDTASGG